MKTLGTLGAVEVAEGGRERSAVRCILRDDGILANLADLAERAREAGLGR